MERTAAVECLTLRQVRGIGDRGCKRLVDAFGSAQAVLCAASGDLVGRGGVSPDLATAIRSAAGRARAEAEVARAEQLGFALVAYGEPEYPALLVEIPDPPPVLYVAGELGHDDGRAVAIVGSRKASTHGQRFARKLARGLAECGFVVVSGLAQGIDAAAHQGALDAAGRTLAVFGAGLDVIYPGWNAELARAIRGSGAWLSELPLGSEPRAHHFPRRNRLISGLARGVVVVEAAERSGSLITAYCALDQGREVFAVPGLPGAYNSRGAHRLLRAGAKLVETVADVLEELAPDAPPGARPAALPQSAPEGALRSLWEVLEDAPRHIDEIAAQLGAGPGEVAAGLLELVLGGHAEEWPGKRYARANP